MPNDVTVTVTVTGNLTADPELRFTNSGQAVASFTIAHTPRYRDTASGEWTDGETWFVPCSAWRDLADNVCGSLTKGHAVMATGRLRARSWENDTGDKRTRVEMTVDDIGPSLRRATAKVIKTVRERADDHTPGTGSAGAGPVGADPWAAPGAPTDTPATGPTAAGGFASEPPF